MIGENFRWTTGQCETPSSSFPDNPYWIKNDLRIKRKQQSYMKKKWLLKSAAQKHKRKTKQKWPKPFDISMFGHVIGEIFYVLK